MTPHPSPSRVRLALGALLATAAATAGCVVSKPKAEVEFRYVNASATGVPVAALTINFDDGGGPRVARGVDLDPTKDRISRWPRFETRQRGTMLVSVILERSPGDTVATGGVVLPLRQDWRWGVDIFVAGPNLANPCLGCEGVRAFPLRDQSPAGQADSLFLIWGGNSISKPVVF